VIDATTRPAPRARRPVAVLALAMLVGAGLVTHFALPDTSAADITGDALYAAAAYAVVVVAVPRLHPVAVAAIAAGWCIGVELFQLTGIPLSAGAAFPPAMLALGTVFDPRDLVVYPAAVAVAWAADAVVGGALARQRAREA
jgi:hypothetical protein